MPLAVESVKAARSGIAVLLIASPLAAGAREGPEAVYAQFRLAAVSGDIEGMLRHGPSTRRAEVASRR